MFQTKEQDKTPEGELSEVKRDNQLNKEFKVMIINMFKELRKGLDEQNEKLKVLNKELANIKNNQIYMKNTITEMKNTLEVINSK